MIKTFSRYFLRALAFLLALFLLSKIFPNYFGMIDVHASPSSTVSFSGTQYFYTSDTVVPGDVTQFTVNNMPSYTFYGLVTGGGTFNSWAIPFTVTKEGFYDISFLTYAKNVWSDNIQPNNISIFDGNSSSQVCTSSMSSPYPSGSVLRTGSLLLNVKCDNIYLKAQQYFVVTNYTFPVQYQGALGHTSMTFIEKTQQQAVIDSIEKTNDTIKDTDTTGASSSGNSFFNDFDEGSEGDLTDLVSLPLNFINHLNDQCQAFTLPMGKMGTVTIPCLSSLWSSSSFANIINIAKIILNGLICYKVGLNLLLFFKDLKDPDKDKLEVMDL